MRKGTSRSLQSNLLIMIATLTVIAKIISGQNLFLVLFLLVACYGIYKETIEGKLVFLLFFSSWIYVLKLDVDSFSFFHIIQSFYLLSCVLFMLKNKSEMSLKVILGFLVFVLYIVMNSGFNSNSNQIVVVGFLMNFLTIVLSIATLKNNVFYERYVVSYVCGLLFSGFVALLGNWIPKVEQHIQNMGEKYTLYENNHLYTRFSGLDLDPNYFSLQVLFAISLLIVVSGYKKKNLKESVFILLLALMGLLTLSKMFFILLIVIGVYTCILYLKYRFSSVIKYLFVLMTILLVAMPLGLADFIIVTISRFTNQGDTTISFTTGRSFLWLEYIQEIIADPRVFLIGNGIGTGFLNGYAAHNMYLSYWYFAGLFGIGALLIFVFYSNYQIRKIYGRYGNMDKNGLKSLPLNVILIANFSLDSIVMDFFPLLLFLSLLSLNYVNGYEGEGR